MTIDKEVFLHGGCWLRADFHLHTAADRLKFFAGEKDCYCSEYIKALKDAQIGIGVIANHNKFDFDEFKALKKMAWKQGVFLLPGVELSVNDGSNGIHTLVVFSDEWLPDRQDHINPFLNVAFEGKTPAEYENANGRSSLALLDTIKKLDGYNRDYFLVFAHVERDNGLWRVLEGGRLKELGKNELFRRRVLAFQQVRTHDIPDSERICRVKVQNWLGEAYPAEVEGSDPKSISEIGKGKACYLKLGDFSFEAVKYALLDHKHRLSLEAQEYPHSRILSVSFDGGVLSGETINFSPELNTLIGIRGSGKSSILEAIRYALDIPFGEKVMDAGYKNDLINHVLGSGGKITLRALDRYGQEYEIRRINREHPDVYVGGVLQPGISLRETILRKPIYFGQKDLSSTGDGFEKDLVEKLVGEKLLGIRSRIAEQNHKIVELVGRLKKLTNAEEKKKEYEGKKQDAEYRLKLYKKYGVEEKLQKQVDFDVDSRKCAEVGTFVENYLRELESFINQYEDDVRNQRFYTSRQNADFFEGFFDEYDQLIASFDSIKEAFSRGTRNSTTLREKSRAFLNLKEGLKEEFAEIERKLAEQLKESGAQAIRPEEFRELRKIVDQASQMLQALTKEGTIRRNFEDDLLKELAALNDLWLEEFRLIQSELDKVNQNHSSLTIKGEFKGDKTAFFEFTKKIFQGSKIQGNRFQNLVNHYVDFAAMYKEGEKARSEVGNLLPAFEQYFNENLEALLTWQVPNRFSIKYRDKELKQHSLGQRASALILFVLSQQENELFLIDQPEDDLDNQTIYKDVIKLIQQVKPKTQFIFATHNANFPVLGDAEQVIVCSYADDKAHIISGSIDCTKIQQEIVDIMEGGEEAFRQRKRRYEVWKPQNFSK